MRTLTLTVFLLALTLTGCLDEPGDTYVTNEGDVVNNYYPDDDDSSTDDDDSTEKTPDDDDSAVIEETEPTRLEIFFTTAWSQLGPMPISPGEIANFGTYLFRLTGEAGAVASIRAKGIEILTKDDSSEAFTTWAPSTTTGISLDQHFENCFLIDPTTGATYQDPEKPENATSTVSFIDDFSMSVEEDGETVLTLQLTCETSTAEPTDEESGFAALWDASSFDVVGEDGNPIDWAILADNGNSANPIVQIWIQHTIETGEPALLYFSRSVSSPGSNGIPGFGSVLRFHVCAPAGLLDVELATIKFDVDFADNTQNGWNTCGSLGEQFDLFDVSEPAYSLVLDKWTTSTGGEICDNVPSAEVGYVYMELAETIPAGTCSTYELWANTVWASAVGDDTAQVNLTDEEWLVWYDQDGNGHDGTNADGLPVEGLSIQF